MESPEQAEKSVLRDYFETIVVTGIVMNFIWLFVFQAFKIPTPSMVDNLLVGDHIFVNKFIFGPAEHPVLQRWFGFRDVRRGDIVVFRFPHAPETDYVKRVVALPGETVEIIDKKVHVNGRVIDEPYAVFTDPRVFGRDDATPYRYRLRDQFGPFTVPDGEYFVMGDNRDESYDSRYWGTVDRSLIKGKPFFVYWSFRSEPSAGEVSLTERLREIGVVAFHFFSRTRWDRTFFIIDSRYHYDDRP